MRAPIYGLVDSLDKALRIVDHLQRLGVDAGAISILLAESALAPAAVPACVGGESEDDGLYDDSIGRLVGIGSVSLPGQGPFVASGPLMATLGGAGIGDEAGSIAGGLRSRGVPAIEAAHLESRVVRGSILVLVLVDAPGRIADLRWSFEGADAREIGPPVFTVIPGGAHEA